MADIVLAPATPADVREIVREELEYLFPERVAEAKRAAEAAMYHKPRHRYGPDQDHMWWLCDPPCPQPRGGNVFP